MSSEMASLASNDSCDDPSDDEMDEADMYNYYNDHNEDITDAEQDSDKDPEHFQFSLLKVEDVERLLNESVEQLCQSIKVSPALAKLLLHTQKWAIHEIIARYEQNPGQLLKDSNITLPTKHSSPREKSVVCPVCMSTVPSMSAAAVACGHLFCKDCWQMYLQIQINSGLSTRIECMANECNTLIPEDFVLDTVKCHKLREKYQQFSFGDFVDTHPELRFCPGPNCSVIVRAQLSKPKRVICDQCHTVFCFTCALEYHAPTDCEVIKKWLTKCADDSETANYISANTKDCPKCHVCIEKNGGCNHMQCYKCKHDFCWMCLGDWKAHGSEYYECSRYKENPNVVNEGAQAQAREALKKYLFYFERWENHAKSLKLEEQTLDKIKGRIQEKVMNNVGTWIDWQYLLNAASLLKKCRYSLQYTYPYAYYLGKGARKEWFEYQQASLEAEVENLSWKVERAEITDRGDLEHQMDIAEKRRVTLLRDFSDTH